MRMTPTEMSMHEAFFFFTVMQAKTNVQSQLVKLFQVKTARYGQKYEEGRCFRRLKAKQGTQNRSEVPGVENIQNAVCGEKKQRKKYSVSSEKECDIGVKLEEKACTPSMVLTTGPR